MAGETNPAPTAPEYERILVAVKESTTEVKTFMDKQDEEIKKYGKSTQETADKLAEAVKRMDQTDADHKGLFESLEKKLNERMDELEKRGQRPGGAGFTGEMQKSLGTKFTELLLANRESVMDALRRRQTTNTPVAEAKGAWGDRFEQKTLSTTETTNFSPIVQRPGIQEMSRRSLRVVDLMPTVPFGPGSSWRYVRQLGFTKATGATVTSITRSSQIATVTLTAHGFRSRDYVKIAGATQTEYNVNARITKIDDDTFSYVVSGSPATPATTGTTITAKRLNNWGNADIVAEGGDKPQAQMYFEEVEGKIEVVAHWLPATRQVFEDVGGLRLLVDNQLIVGLRRKEEQQALYGAGVTGSSLQGIMTLAGVNSLAWSDSGVPTDTRIDVIRRAITISQVMEQDDPTAIVLHPIDSEEIDLTKSSDQKYILVQSPDGAGGARIWRLNQVVTPAIEPGDAILGPWATASARYDREEANVRFSDQHSDYFTKNMVAVLAEERVGYAWFRPESFVKIDFDNAPPEA